MVERVDPNSLIGRSFSGGSNRSTSTEFLRLSTTLLLARANPANLQSNPIGCRLVMEITGRATTRRQIIE